MDEPIKNDIRINNIIKEHGLDQCLIVYNHYILRGMVFAIFKKRDALKFLKEIENSVIDTFVKDKEIKEKEMK